MIRPMVEICGAFTLHIERARVPDSFQIINMFACGFHWAELPKDKNTDHFHGFHEMIYLTIVPL